MSCNHADNFIVESRACNYMCIKGKSQVKVEAKRRRRCCKTCGYRWTTYELEEEFLEAFCRPIGKDELTALRELKNLKHKLASLIS